MNNEQLERYQYQVSRCQTQDSETRDTR